MIKRSLSEKPSVVNEVFPKFFRMAGHFRLEILIDLIYLVMVILVLIIEYYLWIL